MLGETLLSYYRHNKTTGGSNIILATTDKYPITSITFVEWYLMIPTINIYWNPEALIRRNFRTKFFLATEHQAQPNRTFKQSRSVASCRFSTRALQTLRFPMVGLTIIIFSPPETLPCRRIDLWIKLRSLLGAPELDRLKFWNEPNFGIVTVGRSLVQPCHKSLMLQSM